MSLDIDKRLDRLIRKFDSLLERTNGTALDDNERVIEDYIYTEKRENAWINSERKSGYDFTKRIATLLPTKQRRRVTLISARGIQVA